MVNTEFMMYSPLDPQWYTNVYWLLDPIPGGEVTDDSWRGLMQNQCRPVWIMFGDFLQEKTDEAITQVATVSAERGFSDPSNTGGDVIFAFANIKKLGALLSVPEFGAPSTAGVSSVFRSPTHVLYVAGMEYKRFYGVLSSTKIQSECDELASVMQQFRSSRGIEGCPAVDSLEETSESLWSGWESSYSPGSPEISETSSWTGNEINVTTQDHTVVEEIEWTGDSISLTAGAYDAGSSFVWNGVSISVQAGTSAVSEQASPTSAQIPVNGGQLNVVELTEHRSQHSLEEDGYTPPILSQGGNFLIEEQSGWDTTPALTNNGSLDVDELSTWIGNAAFAEDGSVEVEEDTNWNQAEIFAIDGTVNVNEQAEFDQAISFAVDGSFETEEQVEWLKQPALTLNGLFEIDEEVEWDLVPTFAEDGTPSVSESTSWEQISSPQASGGNFGTFNFGGGGGGGGILTP